MIFKTLLANRGHIVSEANVQALNLIDVVFYNDTDVRACLRAFVESATKQPFSAQELETKYLQLIEKMALVLGMKTIDWARIKECVYLPQGLLDKFNEEDLLRKASLQTQIAFAQERLASPRNSV